MKCNTCQNEATFHIELLDAHLCQSCLTKIDARLRKITTGEVTIADLKRKYYGDAIQPAKPQPSALDGLRYALSIAHSRKGILQRPPGYIAACDEIIIFLEAAIERVENGESMHSEAACQTQT